MVSRLRGNDGGWAVLHDSLENTGFQKGLGLKPVFTFEEKDRDGGSDSHCDQGDRVGSFVMKFWHVLKIHAVYSCN